MFDAFSWMLTDLLPVVILCMGIGWIIMMMWNNFVKVREIRKWIADWLKKPRRDYQRGPGGQIRRRFMEKK